MNHPGPMDLAARRLVGMIHIPGIFAIYGFEYKRNADGSVQFSSTVARKKAASPGLGAVKVRGPPGQSQLGRRHWVQHAGRLDQGEYGQGEGGFSGPCCCRQAVHGKQVTSRGLAGSRLHGKMGRRIADYIDA